MDLSPLRGHGRRPRPPEFRVTPLASVCNPEANPVRVMTKYHDMTSRDNRFSCHSGRRADKQGPRSSVWNHAEIEKYATGANFPPVSTRGTSRLRYSSQWPSTSYHHFSDKNQKGKIQREGYIGVKKAYYTAKLLPGKDKTTQTYKICRNKNRDSKPDIDAKNLANQRRYRKTAKAHFNRASENPRQD